LIAERHLTQAKLTIRLQQKNLTQITQEKLPIAICLKMIRKILRHMIQNKTNKMTVRKPNTNNSKSYTFPCASKWQQKLKDI
jgi:hypothetical protein